MMRVEVIAEIGSNWLGNLSLAEKLIREVKKAGADRAKFQMWRARELYDEKHPYWKQILKSEMSFDQARRLKQFSDQLGISWSSSCFYTEAVDYLKSLGVEWFKISHRRSQRDREVMRKIAETRKPTVLSVTEKDDVGSLLSIFKATKEVTLLHCVPEYPTSDERASLGRIVDIQRFGLRVGLSDHTIGTVAPLAAIGLGATVIEKHVKLDETTESPDASVSITVREFAAMVGNVRRAEKMMATGEEKVRQ